MEKFKKRLKKRLAFAAAFNCLAIVFIILTGIYGRLSASGSEDISDMIHGFQVGIFVGIQLIILIYISKYRKAMRNPDELKKLYIEENDERKKLIQDKIGGVGFNFALGGIATATVMSGFFSQVVFLTLLAVLIFTVSVKGFLKLYYRNKF